MNEMQIANSQVKSPLVSVIIPCFNHGQFIEEAIDSALNQTYKNLEVIVVNDGSTDKFTNELLENYSKERVFVYHIKNSGPSVARNFGISKSHGVFILPLDADDKIAETYTGIAVRCFESDVTLGIVYCKAEFFGEITGEWNLPEYKFPDILIDNCIFATAFFRKLDWEKSGGFDEKLAAWEDYDFWLSLIEDKKKIYQIPEVLFFYRQHISSRSSYTYDMANLLDLHIQIFNKHKKIYNENIGVLFNEIHKWREFGKNVSSERDTISGKLREYVTLSENLLNERDTISGKLREYVTLSENLLNERDTINGKLREYVTLSENLLKERDIILENLHKISNSYSYIVGNILLHPWKIPIYFLRFIKNKMIKK